MNHENRKIPTLTDVSIKSWLQSNFPCAQCIDFIAQAFIKPLMPPIFNYDEAGRQEEAVHSSTNQPGCQLPESLPHKTDQKKKEGTPLLKSPHR